MDNTDQTNNIPRRNDPSQMTDTEVMIFYAERELKKMGAHPVLTAAGQLLERVRTMVADYVDGEGKPLMDSSTEDNYA